MSDWNPALYQSSHAFVWKHGSGLLELLAPQPGERILDVGCGTGQLAAAIAQAGASVVGVDSSAAMISQAHSNFPDLSFEQADIRELRFRGEFDAVFSNAVLHWVKPPEAAAAAIARALKPGGRFAAEFGGKGNTAALLEAAWEALDALGCERIHPWYYPSLGEYATLLESNGFELRYATVFDRPIALEQGDQGMANWLEMFGAPFIAAAGSGRKPEFVRLLEEHARPKLYRHGGWIIDYRRLRLLAVKL